MANLFGGVYGHYDYLDPNPVPVVVGCALFAYAYTMAGALVRRWRFPNVPHVFTWAFGLGAARSAFLVGVFMYAFLAGPQQGYIDFASTRVMTRLIFSAWEEEMHAVGYLLAAVWAGLVTLGVIPWLVDRARHFERLELTRGVQSGSVAYE